MRENKKHVLITGASSGIGKSTCTMLAKEGFIVYGGIRKDSDAEELIRENVIPVHLDVNIQSSIDNALVSISKKCGENGVYAIINNAGIAIAGPLEFLSIEKFRYQMETNVIGQLKVIQAFLPLIRKSGGRIVNISSIAGFTAFPFKGAYCASKHAIEAISDSLRRELSPWKIPVIVIEPGIIKTNIWERSLNILEESIEEMPAAAKRYYSPFYQPLIEKTLKKVGQKAISPEHVSKIILQSLTEKKPKTRYLAGRDAKLLNLLKFLPNKVLDFCICQKTGMNRIKLEQEIYEQS